MKQLVIDVENTTTKLNEKYSDYGPYNPNNKLVSIGWMNITDNRLGPVRYVFLHHKDIAQLDWSYQSEGLQLLRQHILEANTIIAHNAKYDVQWLIECGFDVSNKVIEDTMIREYVMARGRGDISLRLGECAKRYGVAEKGELFDKYPDLNIDQMPIPEVEEYGRADIQACAEVYMAQEDRLNRPEYAGLRKTVGMMNQFCGVLAGIERKGIKIDKEALDEVEREFTSEADKLRAELNKEVRRLMGDTPVNLDSPQQLSEVIYSRRIKEGKEEEWLRTFNIGKDDRGKNLRRPKMKFNDYRDNVVYLTDTVMKTRVDNCVACGGKAHMFKVKKDGNLFKRPTKCKVCNGAGVTYTDINEIAGLQMQPRNIMFTTVNGFSTSQIFLDELVQQAEDKKKPEAKIFLEKLMRLSALSSYLSNFVGGIKTFMQGDYILHTNFNQCITATGRLSSTKPNLQNLPRELTFPIRKVFTSRFEGGKITEVDFAQLEFRAAVHLAECAKGKEDILNGIDVHNQTAAIITEAGQPIGRQDAKSRTFKPLYGGVTGSEAERSYYSKFLKELYVGINEQHKEWQEEALATKMITLPTGRQYDFHGVERAWHGGATKYTQIVNYPVQGFATADIVPIAVIRLAQEIKQRQLKSCIVLTVHDSIMVDTHPDEIQVIQELLQKVGDFAEQELLLRYNITMFVPLTCEVKCGSNAMQMKKVA